MADSYTPFGYMPPPFLGPQRRAAPPPANLQSIFDLYNQPLSDTLQPTAQEQADLQRQGQEMQTVAGITAPLALGGPMGYGARALAAAMARYPLAATGAATMAGITGQSAAAGPPQKPKGPQRAVPNANPKAPAKPTPEADPQASDPHLQQLLESDAVLRSLQKQLDEQNAIANAPAGNDPASGSYPKSSRDGARARAADIQKDYNARLMELSRASLPFDQAYPWLAQNRALVAFGAPAVAGLATRTAGNLVSRSISGPWEKAMRGADRAMSRGDDRAYEHFMTRASQFEPRQPGMIERGVHAAGPGIAGAGTGLELSLLPYQHNITNAPVGSPQRAEAEAVLGDTGALVRRSTLGVGAGILGGFTGGHLPNVSPGYRPPRPGPTATAPPPAIAGPTPVTPPPPVAGRPTALPQSPLSLAPQAPPPPTAGPGAMWPAPPAAVPGPPPGLAGLGNQSPRPQPLAPEAPPPVPAQVGSSPKPFPEGAYQDASGRWRQGNRWIRDPSK